MKEGLSLLVVLTVLILGFGMMSDSFLTSASFTLAVAPSWWSARSIQSGRCWRSAELPTALTTLAGLVAMDR